jgi:hypothetical protein
MVEANVKILAALRLFVEDVSASSDLRELLCTDRGAFSRQRKLPLKRLASLLINLPKRSWSVELQDFFACIAGQEQPCSKAALSLQRSKLSPLFFQVWNKWLVDHFYHHYGEKVKRWRSFLLQAVDGSTAYLINKPEIADFYGTQGNKYMSIPMARVIQIYDVLNDLTIHGDLHPVTASEPAVFAKQVHRLATDSLTLLDRCFPSYGLMYLMLNQETPRHFVIRCQSNFNKEVRAFLASHKSSKVVELTPQKESIKILRDHGYIVNASTPLKVRMVKIALPTGEKEILLTSLYDEKLYTVEDLYYLYGLRWRIETNFNRQKNHQQLEQFTGHRVICIQQDYAASLFTANLQSLIEKQCEAFLVQINNSRKHAYQINRNIGCASLKNNIVKIFLQTDVKDILLHLQNLFERYLEPIRPARKYPRRVKCKRTKGKYQTYTNYKRAI